MQQSLFILQPYVGLDLLTTPLGTHLQHLYGSLARDLVEARIVARGTTFEDYAQDFNRTVALQARSLVILMVPIFALLVYAVYGRVRHYFVEHLIFNLHFTPSSWYSPFCLPGLWSVFSTC